MPNPYVRPDEHRAPGPTPGLCVTAHARRYFFPGGTPELAMFLARRALGDMLELASTVIEYGTQDGRVWACERVIKGTEMPGDASEAKYWASVPPPPPNVPDAIPARRGP